MDSAIVLARVRVIDPSSRLDEVVDVTIEGGRITRVGRDAGAELSKREHTRTLDCSGLWAFPGFVDIHVHLREPGHEHKEDLASGLAAAAAGGFTDVCAMPNTNPVNDTRAVTEMMVAKAARIGSTRLHPIGAITRGLAGERLTEMADLRDGGAVAVSDDGRCVTSSAVMRRALEYAKTFDLPVIQHAEDHALTAGAAMHEGTVSTLLGLRGWPRVAEDVIVARDVLLAEYTSARYHVAHTSTLGSVRILREAKSRGLRVTAEVTPHHLLLNHAALLGYDTACKVNPPLREPEDVDALVEALADGTIDCVATDHAPHAPIDKECTLDDAAPGMVGLELCVPLLLSLVHDGRLSRLRFAEVMSTAGAKIVGLPVHRIAEGAAANLTLVDPAAKLTLEPSRTRSKSKNSPFWGREVEGRVMATVVDGRFVFEHARGDSP